MEILIKCSTSMNVLQLFLFVFMCSSSLFFYGGIAATENKTNPIEVEALDAIFRKWKIDGEKTWNISSTNPCTDYVVNDSNDRRVYDVQGEHDILCLCDNNTSVCNIIKLSARDLNISGIIPNELENLKKLVYLDLAENSLTGELPDFLWTLTEMETMYLSGNNFSGPLPLEIGNLKNIQTLDLSDNNFEGKVPNTLWNLTNLIYLSLSYNSFEGTIPTNIGNLVNLTSLYLWRNNFNGSLPSEIGNLKNIQTLSLFHNSFEGTIPTNIGNLVNLTVLHLWRNNFNGSLPSEIGNLKNIQTLYLSDNNFGGKIPDTLWNLKNLNYLYLWRNNFNGPLPSEIGNLKNMQKLDLSYNNFSGPLPSEIGNLENIKYLYLYNNNFSGPLPFEIGNLKNIEYLSLSNNKFGGKIPNSLWNLTTLEKLYLRNCSLEDLLSNERIEMPLRILDLGFNYLVGKLPNNIFHIPTLESIYLNNNGFNDGLPDKKSDNLTTIDLSNNDLEGYIDPKWNEVALNLVNNKFKLEDFKNVSNLKGLECLQQTSNCFKGENLFTSFAINCGGEKIKSEDGTIFEADNNNKTNTYFYVADKNKWAVTFSDRHDLINSTKDITNAQDPKLYQSARRSSKTLRYYGLGLKTGNYTVDLMFAKIDADDSIYAFDISIQGRLEDGDFQILKETGEMSNKALNKKYTIPVTKNTKMIEISFNPITYSKVLISAIKVTPNFKVGIGKNGSRKRSTTVIGVSVGLSIFILLCIVGYCLWARHRKYQNLYKDEGNIELNGLEVNTYRFSELNRATENFKPANKLGEGGFGVVYKGTLYNGDIVAVKKLLAESIQGNEQFIAEVATISEVRQKNLVKLYGCCCQGNKRMLVYEYMENGSLDTALYGRTSQLELDWDIRFTICLGIAKGLNYLHQYSRHRIIHRDIKSSNILLDQHLNPKICDFGLAKLYEDKMTHITTRAAGTYGYLAPEYALSGHLTEKVDVFAFGVVALEIISGKCCIDDSFVSFGPNQTYIIQWAWNIHENDMDDDLAMVDPKLKSFNKEEVCRIIQVALLCTQMDSMSRPSMYHVIAMLNGEKDIGTLPSKPSYLMFWHVGNSSRAVDDIEFQPDKFDSRQQISSCSYSQSMFLQHAYTGLSKQKDEDYTKTF